MVARNDINRGRRQVDEVRLPHHPPAAETEVLIVGAGPTGLAAALELHRHGVDVVVLDAASSFVLPRAGAMAHTARVVELFRRWDVEHRIRRGWTFPPEWELGTVVRTSLAGHDLTPARGRRFDTRPAAAFSAASGIRRPQTALQQAFLDQLASLDVPVSGGWRLETLEETEGGVIAVAQDTATGAQQTIRARYVIGADGSRSTVRRLAGIEREGEYATERHFRFVVRTLGDYPGGHPFPSGTNVIHNQSYSGFLAALSETDWRLYAGPYPVDAVPSTSALLALARQAFGSEVELELLDATPFFKSTRIARTFRRGPFLLVGDAAHVRTPGGNLGEGFGDVANLGWKLAAVLRGQGGEALLDSYDQERRPHNWRVAEHSRARAERSATTLAEARAIGFPADEDDSAEAADRRARIADTLQRGRGPAWGVQFDERYDRSPVIWYEPGQASAEKPWDPDVYEPLALPGHRAPDGYIDPYGGTLYDRLGSDLALLVLSPEHAGAEAFESAAAERGLHVEIIHLADDAARELYGAPFALIRPDHHVVWHGEAVSPETAGAILDHAYGRPGGKERIDELADDVSEARPVAALV